MGTLAAKYNKNPTAPAGFASAVSLQQSLPNNSSFSENSPVTKPTDNHEKPANFQDNIKPEASISVPHPPAHIPPQFLAIPPRFPTIPPGHLGMPPTQMLLNMIRSASNYHQNNPGISPDMLNPQKIPKEILQQHLRYIQQHPHPPYLYPQNIKPSSPSSSQNPTHHESGTVKTEKPSLKRTAESAFPLDLSSTVPTNKFMKVESPVPDPQSVDADINVDGDVESKQYSSSYHHHENSEELMMGGSTSWANKDDVSTWSVEDVFHFVRSIDLCAEYAENFKEQRIDGACLKLLDDEHLTRILQMKLGPALKLRHVVSSRVDSVQQNNNEYSSRFSTSSRSCSTCSHQCPGSNDTNDAYREGRPKHDSGHWSSPDRKPSPASFTNHSPGAPVNTCFAASDQPSPNCSR